jgi:hypothetical protein
MCAHLIVDNNSKLAVWLLGDYRDEPCQASSKAEVVLPALTAATRWFKTTMCAPVHHSSHLEAVLRDLERNVCVDLVVQAVESTTSAGIHEWI